MNDLNEQLVIELKKWPIFAMFNDDELLEIASFGIIQNYKFGQYVVREGEEADSFFFVYSGKVKVMKNIPEEDFSNLRNAMDNALQQVKALGRTELEKHTSTLITKIIGYRDTSLIDLMRNIAFIHLDLWVIVAY